jgi:hypothetical protein
MQEVEIGFTKGEEEKKEIIHKSAALFPVK